MNAANNSSSQPPQIKVAYILHRFPYLTETFIMREMYSLRDNGVDLYIFSLLSPIHSIVHEQARELKGLAHYSPFFSLRIIAALLYFLCRSPVRFFRSVVKTIHQTWREPMLLLRAAVIFPKSVYFARQMQHFGIQHVHAHFVWLEGIAAGIVNDLTDITFSIHPHAFGLFSRNQRDVRAELENANKVVTISKFHRDYIDDLCPGIHGEDVEIVHCSVDAKHFHPPASRVRNEPLRILSVGRLIEKKGHTYLIDACAELQRRGVEFRCDIIGEGGTEREQLQKQIVDLGLSDRVRLAGGLGLDEILSYCQTSDIFALACVRAQSGDQDGIPVVLMEAMACGLPVVTTPIAGIPELVTDNQNGRLVPDRDPIALADAIEQLIRQEGLRCEFGSCARETVIREFGIDKNAARMAHIFRSVIQLAENDEECRVPNVVSVEGRKVVGSMLHD